MRVASGVLVVACIMVGILSFGLLKGQTMSEERVMKLLKDFVALEPNEVTGFDTEGGVVRSWATGKGVFLLQGLSRKGDDVRGKDPTEIRIRASLASDRNIAYQAAISETTSHLLYPDGAGMPQGSWTGLPIGERSWATAPKTRRVSPASNLVVWDDRLAMKVRVDYPPVDPKARNLVFYPIEQSDLELGEMAARLILAKAHYLLLDGNNLPSCAVEVNGSAVSGRQTHEGVVLVPVKPVLERLGGRVEDRLGMLRCAWQGKEVTLPLGARVALVGSWKVQEVQKGARKLSEAEQVSLSLPVVYDGRQAWVDARGLATALGLRAEQRGNTLVLAKQ